MKAEVAPSVGTAVYLQISWHHPSCLVCPGFFVVGFFFIYFNNQRNYQTGLFLKGESLLKSAAVSQLFGVQSSFHSFSRSSAAHVSFIFQNFDSSFKRTMCLCFILYWSWKNTSKMSFQAGYLCPYKSASIYSHFEPIEALLVKQKSILHGWRTQLWLCSGVQSSWGCTRHFKLPVCTCMAAFAPLRHKPARC